MDPLIENLKSTTFFGKRLTRRQIAAIQETVGLFPKLSRTELGHTICEHLRWQTPKGSNRIHLATRLLEELERLGILTLPARSARPGRGPQRPITPGERTAPQPPLREDLAELTPLALEAVTEREAVAEWNEWVERYHPQGYRQPIGAHLRYFLRDRHGRQLGCLLFGFATRNLECRDTWIGWQGQAHRKHLDLVISNSRFLLFPWSVHLFATVECELLQRVRLTNREEAKTEIFRFLEGFYNRRRRHSALGYVAPVEFERSWSEARVAAAKRGPAPAPAEFLEA